jgi:Tol biopolymer transport system component
MGKKIENFRRLMEDEHVLVMKIRGSALFQKAKLYQLAAIVGSVLLAVPSLFANPPQLLSARNPYLAGAAGGNGDSVAPRLSGDGRFVVFSSSAIDLVPNANGQFYLNVFLRDRSSGSTLLISPSCTGNGGGNGDSVLGQVSANGRYVVFQSDASDLVPGDTNGVTDIFLRDTYTGVTRLISVAADGGFANGPSTQPVMTPDGTCVAFISSASNLVAGDTNGIPDVFVRDLITQTTWLVSVGATGANAIMDTPLITPDGRYVAFFSSAQNLTPGAPLNSPGEIYVRDRLANQTIWASTNAAAITASVQSSPYGPSNYKSYHPGLSDDGRYVAFKTGSISLIPAGTIPPPVIYFQYDTVNGTTTMLSTNGFQPWLNCDDVYGPEMTPDGRFIAYVQYEQAGGTNYSSVRLWDRQTGTNVLVSADHGFWPPNSTSHTPALSDDGRYVTFLSDAPYLAGNTVSNGLHIYRRDMQTVNSLLVDEDTNGVGSQDQLGAIPFLSADGSCVAFAASDGGLVAADNNNASDVLLWNPAGGTNALISVHNPQAVFQSGNLPSSLGQLSLSADGRLAAFTSYASDLVPNDFNGDCDVFVRDLAGGSNLLVSVGLDGNSGLGGPSYNPIISADGRYVVFVSAATNLVAGVINLTKASDIFRRDLQNGTTILVSTNLGGSPAGHLDCLSPVSSQDGRYVAFLCRTNSTGIQTNLFWRDLNSGATLTVFTNTHPVLPISMSADGQRLSYFDNQSLLYVWDANLQANIYTNPTPSIMAAALSPHGNRLLYQTTNQLFAYDLAGASNLFSYPSSVPIKGSSQWSGDGRYVAFVTTNALVAGDNNGTNDIYLVDIQAGTLTLVSINQSDTASAAGPSDSPVVSADGRFVVYRTFATDAAAGIMRPPSLIVFDRLSGTNSLLATGTAGTGWTTWLSQPAFSLNGSSLAFQSWDSGLVNGDLNRAADVFAGDLSSWPALDSDADGIPDWWMIEYFGHPTGQAADLSRAQDDADGDGVNNLQEFLAGTIPTNPNSLLALSIAADATRTNLFLGWNAVSGKSYQVLSATNLSNPVWQVFPASIGVNGSQRYFNVQATNSQRYFRVLCGN